jgi:alginate O-acetyltransferase complex protein AlgI
MTFTSPEYLLFFPAVFLAFYGAADRYRWFLLLVASLGFYAALRAPALLVALGLVVVLSYVIALALARAPNQKRRLCLLWLGIGANLAILVGFRYLAILLEAVNLLGRSFHGGGQLVSVIDPVSIGVSYYSFQAISYLVDVYLGVAEPEKHFGRFALYIGFFPKLLQGPIERASSLLPQLRQLYAVNYENLRSGLFLFAIGLFKKLVLADRLAMFVDEVYGNVHAFGGLPLILATYLYAFQIYCDFSGYSDMALGVARLFNLNLTQNFESPYRATSVAEFWRRWHISFSRWILDYIFKPLQLRLRGWGDFGTATALLVTFLLCGLWHGATGGFLIWGGLHGVYLSVDVFSRRLRKRSAKVKPGKFRRAWRVVATFHLVCLGWVFFRARSVADAMYVLEHAIVDLPSSLVGLIARGTLAHDVYLNQSNREFLVALGGLVLLALSARVGRSSDALVSAFFARVPWLLRWATYLGLALGVIVFGVFYGGAFIYFQF